MSLFVSMSPLCRPSPSRVSSVLRTIFTWSIPRKQFWNVHKKRSKNESPFIQTMHCILFLNPKKIVHMMTTTLFNERDADIKESRNLNSNFNVISSHLRKVNEVLRRLSLKSWSPSSKESIYVWLILYEIKHVHLKQEGEKNKKKKKREVLQSESRLKYKYFQRSW